MGCLGDIPQNARLSCYVHCAAILMKTCTVNSQPVQVTMYCILAHSHADHSYCNGAPVQAPVQQCTVIWWLIMRLFFSPVQEILFADIESGPHETLSTNMDTSVSFANFLEYVCAEIRMCHVILITVCRSFRALSIARSQHSTNRTHCVLFYL